MSGLVDVKLADLWHSQVGLPRLCRYWVGADKEWELQQELDTCP